MVKGFASRGWLPRPRWRGKPPKRGARRELACIPWRDQDPDACEWDSERSIARAWVCAAEGATSQAITTSRTAAAMEAELGRPAWEVVLLQTATQLGDRTTAGRLAELATLVQGPRAAAAVAAADGQALITSRQYEAFGDRLAAADAAAHAVVAHQKAGQHGSALTSAATRSAPSRPHGARTPALRAAAVNLHHPPARSDIACRTRAVEQGNRRQAHHVDSFRRRPPLPRLAARPRQQPRTTYRDPQRGGSPPQLGRQMVL